MKKVLVLNIFIGLLAVFPSHASIVSLGIVPALSRDFRNDMDWNCAHSTGNSGNNAACGGAWILGLISSGDQVAFNYVSADSALVQEGVLNKYGKVVKIDDESVRLAYNYLLESGMLNQIVSIVNSKLVGVDPKDEDQVALNFKKALEEILMPSPTVPEFKAINIFLSIYYGVTFTV